MPSLKALVPLVPRTLRLPLVGSHTICTGGERPATGPGGPRGPQHPDVEQRGLTAAWLPGKHIYPPI